MTEAWAPAPRADLGVVARTRRLDDAPPAAALSNLRPAPTPADGPGAFEVRSARPPSEWTDAVATATAHIRAGQLDKVVLAREITVTADRPIPIATVLARLSVAYP